ncbi:helix-turn-helix transcriptional regulator [Polaromonas sp.]|uniref:helix-turn-helix transcriptional regulator n=1 Tax=Polaromonas sp. TaxID=1869339 RepID=UPI003BAC788F
MKGTTRSSSRTLASIRQLCSMGLSQEFFIVKFLEVLRDWVPADTCHFVWADGKTLHPVNYSGDAFSEMRALNRYLTHNALIDAPGLFPAFPQVMRTLTSGLFGCDADNAKIYLGSDFYDEVLHPLDGRYMLYLVARNQNDEPQGLFVLLRSKGGKAFTDADRQKLLQLEPYLRFAFSVNSHRDMDSDNQDGEGMLILNSNGEVSLQDRQARRLFWMASHEQINGKALIHLDSHGLTPQIRRLHQRLVSIFQDRESPPPSFECRNRWGRFVFRCSWLHGQHEQVAGVRITHYIPRILKTWQGLHRLDLAPRQQQVALLYSEERTTTEIASELNISRHTAAEYIDVIYNRLDIPHTRKALQEALLQQAVA